jgi:hypothetical protein
MFTDERTDGRTKNAKSPGELKNDYKKCVWHAKLFKLAKDENDHQYAL